MRLFCILEPPVGRFASRRKSVFAETYNPEEDEEDDGFKVMHYTVVILFHDLSVTFSITRQTNEVPFARI